MLVGDRSIIWMITLTKFLQHAINNILSNLLTIILQVDKYYLQTFYKHLLMV